jgi:deoxyribonuclease-4
MPTPNGLGAGLRKGFEIGCNTVQVFTKSPQQWGAKPLTDDVIADFKAASRETSITELIAHDSYLINLAATEEELRERSLKALINEMNRCESLGIKALVSHMGAHKGSGEEKGLEWLAEGAKKALEQTSDAVILAMETTAGQGTSLGYRFEHLAYVLDKNKGHRRLRVCLDTCHIFSAGYDIRTAETYEKTITEFDEKVGCDRLAVIHANDSAKPFGERKDRHAHIGEGEIGEMAFRLLVKDKRLIHVPIIIETPEAEKMHEENVKKLKSYLEDKNE